MALGDIGQASRRIDVIAVVFDLSGFTDCCNHVDAHLSMPIFLKEFLSWLFKCIVSELEQKRFREGILLYTHLPFFAKFTGDGVLFLWNTENMDIKKYAMLWSWEGIYAPDIVIVFYQQ